MCAAHRSAERAQARPLGRILLLAMLLAAAPMSAPRIHAGACVAVYPPPAECLPYRVYLPLIVVGYAGGW